MIEVKVKNKHEFDALVEKYGAENVQARYYFEARGGVMFFKDLTSMTFTDGDLDGGWVLEWFVFVTPDYSLACLAKLAAEKWALGVRFGRVAFHDDGLLIGVHKYKKGTPQEFLNDAAKLILDAEREQIYTIPMTVEVLP